MSTVLTVQSCWTLADTQRSHSLDCFSRGPSLIELSDELKVQLREAAGLIRSELADTPVPVEYTLKPIFQPRPNVNRGHYSRRMLPFAEALAKVLASPARGPTYYISGLPLSRFPISLAKPVSLIASVLHTPPFESFLFIGGLNSGSFLHYDLTHNLMIGIEGEKEVHLIDPRRANGIKPYSAVHQCRRYAALPRNHDGLARLPEGTKTLVARVGPGQVLGIPAHWWHQVRNSDLAISVSLALHRPWYDRLVWADLRCYIGDLANKSKLVAENTIRKMQDYPKSSS
ncbi:cupin-like domain-containing protein [Bradyrhizobium murdochi]|uniref:cupin-like domain-containing protein n=1 Tax=Bradyrhizobium murdochi TaxID=1038859 RepID=UPI003D320610